MNVFKSIWLRKKLNNKLVVLFLGSTDGVEENDESSAVETNTQHEEDLFYTLMFRGFIMCK